LKDIWRILVLIKKFYGDLQDSGKVSKKSFHLYFGGKFPSTSTSIYNSYGFSMLYHTTFIDGEYFT
jgi:hypothetical protein